MTDTTAPLVDPSIPAAGTAPVLVNEAVLPATAAAGLRMAVNAIGPSLIASGYLPAGSLEGVTTMVITATSIGYGLWKTHQRKSQLVAAAKKAPDTDFIVRARSIFGAWL